LKHSPTLTEAFFALSTHIIEVAEKLKENRLSSLNTLKRI